MRTKVLAFLGNRHTPLSRAFFRGVLAARDVPSFELILVDTATAKQASLRSRLRNVAVSAVKSVLRVGVRTSTLDWFGDAEARTLCQITPPDHDLGAPGFVRDLKARAVEAVLVAGCDQILRQPVVSTVPRIVNFHNGLLPEYRGVGAVQWAFLNREAVAGYTFHTIEGESIDRGRPVLRRELEIRPRETPLDFDKRLIQDAVGHINVVLAALLSDVAWPPATQAFEGGAYYSAKRMRRQRRFDPSLPIEETLHRFRVLGSLDLGGGRVPLKLTSISSATLDQAGKLAPGRWMRLRGSVIARCSDGCIEIRSIDYLPAAAAAWLLPAVLEALPPATSA